MALLGRLARPTLRHLPQQRHAGPTSQISAFLQSGQQRYYKGADAEAQKRLMQASASSMSVLYCREPGNDVFRWLRGLTIDSNFDFHRWRRHQRATKHLTMWWPSTVIRADNTRRLIFPDLMVVFTLSSLLSFYNVFLASAGSILTLPVDCFSLTATALGLLVTFKTQQCYGRYDDARGQWGLIVNETRSLAARILVRVPGYRGSDDESVMLAKKSAVKLIKSFPHTLKYHVTEDGCNPHIQILMDTTDAELKAATTSALRAELHGIWDKFDPKEAEIVERICSPSLGNRPLFVLQQLTMIYGKVFADPMRGAMEPVISMEMDRSVTLLQHVLGRCERILRTPIYSPYSKFTARFLSVWCGGIPFALYPLLGPVITPPASVIIGFFLLGIQDIGTRVEQPFDVLPLWQYCAVIDGGVDQMVKEQEIIEQKEAKQRAEEENAPRF